MTRNNVGYKKTRNRARSSREPSDRVDVTLQFYSPLLAPREVASSRRRATPRDPTFDALAAFPRRIARMTSHRLVPRRERLRVAPSPSPRTRVDWYLAVDASRSRTEIMKSSIASASRQTRRRASRPVPVPVPVPSRARPRASAASTSKSNRNHRSGERVAASPTPKNGKRHGNFRAHCPHVSNRGRARARPRARRDLRVSAQRASSAPIAR